MKEIRQYYGTILIVPADHCYLKVLPSKASRQVTYHPWSFKEAAEYPHQSPFKGSFNHLQSNQADRRRKSSTQVSISITLYESTKMSPLKRKKQTVWGFKLSIEDKDNQVMPNSWREI